MKILPIDNCDDCPHYRWIDVNYCLECGLTYELVRYKEIGVDKALMKLFNQCPLQEYSISEINLLSAFLIEQGLAEEYMRWKREGEQGEENIYTPSKKPMRFIGGKPLFKREYL